MNNLIALFSGLIFGVGLIIGQMVNPAKVIAFLDLAGEWNPSLALVMAGAIAVALPAFYWAKKQTHSLNGMSSSLPYTDAGTGAKAAPGEIRAHRSVDSDRIVIRGGQPPRFRARPPARYPPVT